MSINEAFTTSRTIRKKEEKKKRITAKAIELFQQQGLDRTTMEQIAEGADIAKGTLYNYFPSKEAIIDEFVQESFKKKYADRIKKLQKLPDTQARIEFMLCQLIEDIQGQSEIFERHIVYTIQKITSLKREKRPNIGFELLAEEIIRLGQKNGEIRKDLPFNIMVGLIEFAFIQLVQQFYMDKEGFDARKVIGLCVDLCINGAKEAKKTNCGKD